jgi:hypothetical protein
VAASDDEADVAPVRLGGDRFRDEINTVAVHESPREFAPSRLETDLICVNPQSVFAEETKVTQRAPGVAKGRSGPPASPHILLVLA